MSSGQLCTFRVGGLLLAVPVEDVQEVLRHQVRTSVPLAPHGVVGLLNLRGQIVTTLDLRTRLGLPDAPAADGGVDIVVRSRDGVVSLLADEVGDVLLPDPALLTPPPPTVPDRVRDLIAAVCRLEDELVLVLHVDLVAAVGG